MKTYGGVDVQIHIFLTSALVGGEWSASHRPIRSLNGCREASLVCCVPLDYNPKLLVLHYF
jgi:hypothetical protein